MELADMHPLDKNETFCTFGSWKQAREAERLLVATSLGYARGFPLRILRESIEAPVPLRLDKPLPGLPVTLFGASGEEDLLLLTDSGRGTRWPVRALDISGTQAVNCGKEDRLRLALPVRAGEDVFLITEDGYGRRLLPEWLDVPDRPNQKARSLIARRSDLAGAGKAPTWAITTETVRPIDVDALPLADSTRTEIALSIGAGESVQTLFSRPV
jgi:hypothetical protein